MTVFVLGHGSHDASEASTFVPRGMEVHFHADFDEGLPFSLGLHAFITGAAGGSRDHYVEMEKIPNYQLSRLADNELASYLTVDRGDATLYIVGDQLPSPTRLCTGNEQSCLPRVGMHRCGGILGQLASQREIHLIACRLERQSGQQLLAEGKPLPRTSVVAGETDPDFYLQVQEMWKEFRQRAEADPAAAGTYFDSQPEGTRTYLLQSPWINQWSQARQAHAYLDHYGPYGLYRYYVSQPQEVRGAIDQDPVLSAKMVAAQKILAWFLDPSKAPDDRLRAWAKLTNQQREDLMACDDTGWLYQWATSAGAVPSAQPAIDWAEVDWHNGSVLYGMGYGDETQFAQAGELLLIGNDTSYWQVGQYLSLQPGHCLGTLRVVKPLRTGLDTMASGLLTVTGCTDQAGFQAAIVRLPPEVFLAEVSFA